MHNAATKGQASPKKKRIIRHRGICAGARALGVTYTHLYRVLTGERKGRPGLVEAYRAHAASAKTSES